MTHTTQIASATLLAGVLGLTATSTIAHASVVPFTETFASGHANWGGGGDWTTFAPLAWTAPGGDGPQGGFGYVSNIQNFAGFDPGAFPAITLFRGQDNYNSSNNAFVGNWITSGVTEFSFWVRHDAPIDVQYSVRFTPILGNSPSMNFVFSELAQAGVWTQYTLDISPDTPGWIVGGGPNTYNAVFGNLGKIQIGAELSPLAGIDQEFSFDLSLVSVAVPAPGTLALFALAGLGRTRRRALAA